MLMRMFDQLEQISGLRVELIGYAQRFVHNQATAEDLVQDAFLRYEELKESVAHPKAWLYRVTRNLAFNHLRGRKEMVVLDEQVVGEEQRQPDGSDSPRLALEKLQRLHTVQTLIEGLPEREKQLLKLKFEEELSYKEISQVTGLSVSNVGYVLCQTIRSLQNSLREENL